MEKAESGKTGLRVAIYDTRSKAISRRLTAALRKAGHEVLCDGPLTPQTAAKDADIWLTKWTYNLKGPFLKDYHPVRGIVTLSMGTDHIDTAAVRELGLRLESCPSFCSNSVAEHALALAMRTLHKKCVLPPLSEGQVIFTNFSDRRAENAVAQMLMRARQLEASIRRAENYDYGQHDRPWQNEELSAAKIGIVGHGSSARKLARMVRYGFNCDVFSYDAPAELEAYGVKPLFLLDLIRKCDYIFLCTERYGMIDVRRTIDSREFEDPAMRMTGSSVAVLGTGNIGMIIARMARLGFGCSVTAFSRTPKKEAMGLGVKYVSPQLGVDSDPVTEVISGANISFIGLSLNERTRGMLGKKQLAKLPADRPRVLVNVTRDEIIESQALYDYICTGALTGYATDVLPNDKILCSGGLPDQLTRNFVQHKQVVATPHEGGCSRHSLKRLCMEALQKIDAIVRGETHG